MACMARLLWVVRGWRDGNAHALTVLLTPVPLMRDWNANIIFFMLLLLLLLMLILNAGED